MNQMAITNSQRTGGEGGVRGVSPDHLMLSLLERTQEKVLAARDAIENRNSNLKSELLRSAIAIIDGIRESLDFETDGDTAFSLSSAYDDIERLMVEANVLADEILLDEVIELLQQLKSGRQTYLLGVRKV